MCRLLLLFFMLHVFILADNGDIVYVCLPRKKILHKDTNILAKELEIYKFSEKK